MPKRKKDEAEQRGMPFEELAARVAGFEEPEWMLKSQALHMAACEIFGILGIKSGWIEDDYGGDLFYIYRIPSSETPIKLGKGFTPKKGMKEAGQVLPRARAEYIDDIHGAIRHALKAIAQESLQQLSKSPWRTPASEWTREWKRALPFGAAPVTLENSRLEREVYPQEDGEIKWRDLPGRKEYLEGVWWYARKQYRNARNFNAWIDIIKNDIASKYDGLILPVDLILRLSGERKYLTDKAMQQLDGRKSITSAADIAIEHAARLCGAEDYQFGWSYLYRKLRENKRPPGFSR